MVKKTHDFLNGGNDKETIRLEITAILKYGIAIVLIGLCLFFSASILSVGL